MSEKLNEKNLTERLAISFLLFEKICDQSYLEVYRFTRSIG